MAVTISKESGVSFHSGGELSSGSACNTSGPLILKCCDGRQVKLEAEMWKMCKMLDAAMDDPYCTSIECKFTSTMVSQLVDAHYSKDYESMKKGLKYIADYFNYTIPKEEKEQSKQNGFSPADTIAQMSILIGDIILDYTRPITSTLCAGAEFTVVIRTNNEQVPTVDPLLLRISIDNYLNRIPFIGREKHSSERVSLVFNISEMKLITSYGLYVVVKVTNMKQLFNIDIDSWLKKKE